MIHFNWPIELNIPDSYCGDDFLCAQGGTEIWSILLITAIIGIGFLLGLICGLSQKND